MHDTIFVGMDVHKATISVAVGDGGRGGEVRQLGNFLNRADHVDKLVQRLSKTSRALPDDSAIIMRPARLSSDAKRNTRRH